MAPHYIFMIPIDFHGTPMAVFSSIFPKVSIWIDVVHHHFELVSYGFLLNSDGFAQVPGGCLLNVYGSDWFPIPSH